MRPDSGLRRNEEGVLKWPVWGRMLEAPPAAAGVKLARWQFLRGAERVLDRGIRRVAVGDWLAGVVPGFRVVDSWLVSALRPELLRVAFYPFGISSSDEAP